MNTEQRESFSVGASPVVFFLIALPLLLFPVFFSATGAPDAGGIAYLLILFLSPAAGCFFVYLAAQPKPMLTFDAAGISYRSYLGLNWKAGRDEIEELVLRKIGDVGYMLFVIVRDPQEFKRKRPNQKLPASLLRARFLPVHLGASHALAMRIGERVESYGDGSIRIHVEDRMQSEISAARRGWLVVLLLTTPFFIFIVATAPKEHWIYYIPICGFIWLAFLSGATRRS